MDKIEQDDKQYGIVLPCKPADFTDFIAGLLGKPQTIEKRYAGSFIIGIDEAINIHHLITQRVEQQNESNLIQFVATIHFDDDTSVTVNDIESLSTYNEVAPKNSISLTLTWIYLIKFQKKNFSEKQQIDITFNVEPNVFKRRRLMSYVFLSFGSIIHVRINHTERTWGVDVESLITNYIDASVVNQKGDHLRRFLSQNSRYIGATTTVIVFSALLYGLLLRISTLSGNLKKALAGFDQSGMTAIEIIGKKIDIITDVSLSGTWSNFTLYSTLYIILCIVFSFACGMIVSSQADKSPKSFILFSKKSENEFNEYKKKKRMDILYFLGSILLSSISGIIVDTAFRYGFFKFTHIFNNILTP